MTVPGSEARTKGDQRQLLLARHLKRNGPCTACCDRYNQWNGGGTWALIMETNDGRTGDDGGTLGSMRPLPDVTLIEAEPSAMARPTSGTESGALGGRNAGSRQDRLGASDSWCGVCAGSGVGVRPTASSMPFRLRSWPRLHVSGKVRFTPAAGHLPSVRCRGVGSLHHVRSNPLPGRPSGQRARTRRRDSESQGSTTSSGAAPLQGMSVDELPVHGFMTLLANLARMTLNEVTLPGGPGHAFPMIARSMELQLRAFELPEVELARDVAMQVTGRNRRNRPLAP